MLKICQTTTRCFLKKTNLTKLTQRPVASFLTDRTLRDPPTGVGWPLSLVVPSLVA